MLPYVETSRRRVQPAWLPCPLSSDVDSGKRIKQSKDIEDPENHGDDYDTVQNRLDGSLHGNEAIHQPQEDTHHDENFEELN
jgi:hypothetical protein